MSQKMKRIFFGHRGVGKSALLERHWTYVPDVPHFDLDQEISKRFGRTISEIFQTSGEQKFRKLEQEMYFELSQNDSFVISVGGGFDVAQLGSETERILVRRTTDKGGRLFLNRPRLEPHLDALQEYLARYKQRQPKFLQCASWVYDLPEGDFVDKVIESQIFKAGRFENGGYITVPSDQSEVVAKFSQLELRSDLVSKSLLLQYLDAISSASSIQLLVSIRRDVDLDWLQNDKLKQTKANYPSKIEVDFGLELGQPTAEQLTVASVISSHESDIASAMKKLNNFKSHHLKLCPVVCNFQELMLGHKWQSEDPSRRSFLPRSPQTASNNPRWQWYRILQSRRQQINFISQLDEISDQPTLYQTIQAATKSMTEFGAVLGDPVAHSWTPAHHTKHFSIPTVAIPLNESTFHEDLICLKELGLSFAAVTSPLKPKASETTKVEGCNSMVTVKGQWQGTNTDILAMNEILKQNITENDVVAFWGGGGVLESIRKQHSEFHFYSSRSGKLKSENKENQQPTVVIWAAPRLQETLFPPKEWNPRLVIDLNYSESSMGLEYVQRLSSDADSKLKYVPGRDFFLIQAKHQIEFFKKLLSK